MKSESPCHFVTGFPSEPHIIGVPVNFISEKVEHCLL